MPLPWRLKRWDGAQWVDAECRRWNGSSWVVTNMYFWDGANWVLCTDRTPPTQTYTRTYNNVWAQTYRENNSKRTDSDGETKNYQGRYDSLWGNQRSMWGFSSTIRTNIQGAVAFYSNTCTFKNLHTYYNAGMTVVIGTHAVPNSEAGSYSENRYGIYSSSWSRGEQRTISFGPGLGQWTADGTFYGFTLRTTNNSVQYYGYFTNSITLVQSYEK